MEPDPQQRPTEHDEDEHPRPTPPPRRQDDDDRVDEASDESFPASDPPSYTPAQVG